MAKYLILTDYRFWQWRWRRPLFAWEEELFGELENLMSGVEPQRDACHTWIWCLGEEKTFTIKSTYIHLLSLYYPLNLDQTMSKVFQALWRSVVPSKV